MGGGIGTRMEIFETSGLQIPMILRLRQKQWLYQKEATGMESSKMYCPSRCRNSTYQCGAANYPVSLGAVYGLEWKDAKFGGTYRHGTAFPQEECLYQKEATGTENPKMCCSSPWENDTYLCGSANYPVSWVVV